MKVKKAIQRGSWEPPGVINLFFAPWYWLKKIPLAEFWAKSMVKRSHDMCHQLAKLLACRKEKQIQLIERFKFLVNLLELWWSSAVLRQYFCVALGLLQEQINWHILTLISPIINRSYHRQMSSKKTETCISINELKALNRIIFLRQAPGMWPSDFYNSFSKIFSL